MINPQKALLIGLGALLLTTCKEAPLREWVLTEEIKITELERDVFLITHSFPWPANSLLVVLDEDAIVWIDTTYTPESTSKVLDWIKQEIGEDYNIAEINTGFHIDNLGGNQELIKRKIPIYGSDLTAELLRTRSGITMSKISRMFNKQEHDKYFDTYTNFEFYAPTNLFPVRDEQILRWGSKEVIIYYPGPTHTYDNLVVYIPGKRLLFGGCMILTKEVASLGYIDDGNLEEWEKSLKNLENRFKDAQVIIPGHGAPGGFFLIHHTINIINSNLGSAD